MVLGRMVRCFEFQRPLMSLLRNCWPKGSPTMRRPMSVETIRALVRARVMLLMAFADLRLEVDGLVTASDASEEARGLCAASCLTDEGPTLCVQGILFENSAVGLSCSRGHAGRRVHEVHVPFCSHVLIASEQLDSLALPGCGVRGQRV